MTKEVLTAAQVQIQSNSVCQRQNHIGQSDFATKRQLITLCHIHVSRAQQVEKSERASDCDIKHYEMHISVHVKAWFGDDVGKRQIVPSRAEAKKKHYFSVR
ncbi:hypothetical protein CY34DRAFT_808621 [Suillus luteus UH-Slu-Lm8-n1]|uniref:Uncharacterized protein n=1 Tax=Suillus luteus UH-Slu-Lm8-n1 TaxID=930992 RepID=A0A0D0AM12_9AGAM|nr:hypothetical protein CY34DRAFT_808621 [Suillus luteus UH-Slu-Lm8-n1]